MNTISLSNKNYDEISHALTGFDIMFGKERIHVDLSNYFPASKTASEVRQIREDVYHTYQIAIASNYHSTELLLMNIAKQFPDGINWTSPGQNEEKHINSNVLHMQGKPDMSFASSEGYGETFIKLHELRVSSQQHCENPDIDYDNTKLAEEISIVEKNAHLSNEQMHMLSSLIAAGINHKLLQQQAGELDIST